MTDPQASVPTPTPIPDNRDGAACDLCGHPMDGRHCKLACPSCGFIRDCSDL